MIWALWNPYTWTNGRGNIHNIKTCIDRVHATSDWITLFPESKVFHLSRVKSDHCPILLKTNNSFRIGPKPFRFESMWMSHKDFPNIVKTSWKNLDLDLHETIDNFKNDLTHWKKTTLKNIFEQKKKNLSKLAGIQKNPHYCSNDQLIILEKNLNEEYLNILKNEEELWMLKSIVSWLSLEDKNTTFFHKSALIRRRRNKITQLIKQDGTVTQNSLEIGTEILNFLTSVHSQPPPNTSSVFQPPNSLPKIKNEDFHLLISPLIHMNFF